nr:MAG TPA: hypothetical protein [Bacteriophage sp.]
MGAARPPQLYDIDIIRDRLTISSFPYRSARCELQKR